MTTKEKRLLAKFRKNLETWVGGFYWRFPVPTTEEFKRQWKILRVEYALAGRKPPALPLW
jgi:hypothetical protein